MFWPRREGAMLYLNILWVNKCAIPINVFSHFQNNAMWYVAIHVVLSVTKSVTKQILRKAPSILLVLFKYQKKILPQPHTHCTHTMYNERRSVLRSRRRRQRVAILRSFL